MHTPWIFYKKGRNCDANLKVEKTGIISTKFSLRCTPSVILGHAFYFAWSLEKKMYGG